MENEHSKRVGKVNRCNRSIISNSSRVAIVVVEAVVGGDGGKK